MFKFNIDQFKLYTQSLHSPCTVITQTLCSSKQVVPWALDPGPEGRDGPLMPFRNEFSQCKIESSQIKGRDLSGHLRFHKLGNSKRGVGALGL